ncbi:uncharacterized protein LOC116256427 [Nymphaea colorata]|nr:uncharacterized protein LOC116256427 [Nymphaea colorata]
MGADFREGGISPARRPPPPPRSTPFPLISSLRPQLLLARTEITLSPSHCRTRGRSHRRRTHHRCSAPLPVIFPPFSLALDALVFSQISALITVAQKSPSRSQPAGKTWQHPPTPRSQLLRSAVAVAIAFVFSTYGDYILFSPFISYLLEIY